MSPRQPFDRFRPPTDADLLRGSTDCAGCGAPTDPDALCDDCRARREEYGEHSVECDCAGCGWYRDTDRELRARGLR